MSGFDDRQKGFEAQYKRDQELQFKVTARRNRLVGMWAAEKLGLAGAEAEAYAKEVVKADFDRPGDDDVLEKIAADFAAKGVSIDKVVIRHEMDKLLPVAKDQLSKA